MSKRCSVRLCLTLCAIAQALLLSAVIDVQARPDKHVQQSIQATTRPALLDAADVEHTQPSALQSSQQSLVPIRLRVEIPKDVKLPAELAPYVSEKSRRLLGIGKGDRLLTLDSSSREAVTIALESDEVRSVEVLRPPDFEPVPMAVPLNRDAAISHRVPDFLATFNSNNGGDVVVAVFDQGAIRHTHQELVDGTGQSRATVKTAEPLSYHATHVAGTIGATGLRDAAKGMASAVKLLSFDWEGDLLNLEASASEASVSNHSYGPISGWYQDRYGDWYWWGDRTVDGKEDSKYGKYSSDSRQLDTLLSARENLITIVAAGNERGSGGHPPFQPIQHYVIQPMASGGLQWIVSSEEHHLDDFDQGGLDTISGMGIAKNCITVGAVHDVAQPNPQVSVTSFSSWGPADDGRIKPDIVANGQRLYSISSAADDAYLVLSGTSMATPTVAGICSLLVEHYQKTKSTAPTSAEIKAVLIHTAADAGNPGPDPVYGWGSIDAFRAGQVIAGQNDESVSMFEVAAGTTFERNAEAVGTMAPRVTIVWIDPPAAQAGNGLDDPTATLQNDLDLTLVAPDSTVFFPYSLNRTAPLQPATKVDANKVDNVEVIDAPAAPGQWKIQVKGAAHADQRFALVITGLQILPATTPGEGR